MLKFKLKFADNTPKGVLVREYLYFLIRQPSFAWLSNCSGTSCHTIYMYTMASQTISVVDLHTMEG